MEEKVAWTCETCEGDTKVYSHKAKGQREMLQHLDGREWFSSVYRWTIGDVVAIQSVTCERAPDDMMRYS